MRTLPVTGATERETLFAIRQLIEGRSNAVGSVTLAAGAASTTVSGDTINANAIVILAPKTANAAAAVATTSYSVSPAGGAFTLTHANNAQTDRTFGYLVIGG